MIQNLNSYQPREYQLPILKALNSGYKRVLAILPRRAGKDITALNHVIRQMYINPGVYYYIFPTYAQAKKVIWDSMTNDGHKILDYFPKDLVIQKNSQEMKIRMKAMDGKESLFQLVGSDNYDTLVGTNPRGCVFSEYALQDPMAYQFISPILTANGGWALFITTPRGKNALWDLLQIAIKSPHWFVTHLTVEDTKHIPIEEIDKERAEGIMSEDMIQQEYYTSFTMGVEGAYYAKYMDIAKREGRIGNVSWETHQKVHTAWDLGYNDTNAIIFFHAFTDGSIRIIDCYENNKLGLDHYIKVIKEKPYIYGKHIGPHDIRVHDYTTGISRWESARQMGLTFVVADDVGKMDGIESGRALFNKIYIDEKKCGPLVRALENYRQEWDSKRKSYKKEPLHNWASNFADAYRYLAISLPKTKDGMSAQELDRRFLEAKRGNSSFDWGNPHSSNNNFRIR